MDGALSINVVPQNYISSPRVYMFTRPISRAVEIYKNTIVISFYFVFKHSEIPESFD